MALYRMVEQGHHPTALITTVNAGQKRSWFHGISNELMQDVSNSMGIPLILCECTPDNYTQAYEHGLGKAREMGADACVFGDIDIDEHKLWNEERCKKAGLSCILPLWKLNREALVHEVLDSGFKAVIKTIDSRKLDVSFLGQDLTAALIADIKAVGVDPCGENGEYHTFVYDGPIFARPVPFITGEAVDLGTHKAIELRSVII